MNTLQNINSNQLNKHQIKNGGYTVLPNVAPIDRTKFSKKDNKYIDCALFLCGYLGVENCTLSNWCSLENEQDFYSYRRQQKTHRLIDRLILLLFN